MPLIKNKIVAVYHCNKIQEALTLWHQKSRFFQLHECTLPTCQEWGKWMCGQRERRATIRCNTRRAGLVDTSYRVRQKPEMVISCCVINLIGGDWVLGSKYKFRGGNVGEIFSSKKNNRRVQKYQPGDILRSEHCQQAGWKNVKIQTVASPKDSTKWIFNDPNRRVRDPKNTVILVKYYP